MSTKSLLSPKINKTLIHKERDKYPKNSIILGTIGRLTKLDNIHYLKTIIDIMEKYPNTIYLACGYGDNTKIKKVLSKSSVLDRWFFPGFVNNHLYGHLIDIWANSFPNPQGLSTLEFMAKGKPVVTLKNKHHNYKEQKKVEKKFYKDLPYPMVANDIKSYIDSLELLIKNKISRQNSGKLFKNYIQKNYYIDSHKSFYLVLDKIRKIKSE